MGFKIAITNILKNLKENINIMIKIMENIRKDSNGNYYRVGICNVWTIKFASLA